jgi:hypothetical protein
MTVPSRFEHKKRADPKVDPFFSGNMCLRAPGRLRRNDDAAMLCGYVLGMCVERNDLNVEPVLAPVT